MINASGGSTGFPSFLAFVPCSVLCIILLAPAVLAQDSAPDEDPFYDPFEEETKRIELWDPIEPWNRGVFYVNDRAYDYVLSPTSRGWEYITTPTIRTGVSNFFGNLREPRNTINGALQGEVWNAEQSLGRFLINSVFGLGGIFDVAKPEMEQVNRTFDQTLSTWGVGPGPFLMLPGLGPSTVRGTTGLIVDGRINPTSELGFGAAAGLQAINVANQFTGIRDDYRELREMSVDPYLGLKSAYENQLERRRDGEIPWGL